MWGKQKYIFIHKEFEIGDMRARPPIMKEGKGKKRKEKEGGGTCEGVNKRVKKAGEGEREKAHSQHYEVVRSGSGQ